MDTDTLLACIRSLVDAREGLSDADLLDALADADGDVQRAAARLDRSGTGSSSSSAVKKRKASTLEGWLGRGPSDSSASRRDEARKSTQGQGGNSRPSSSSQAVDRNPRVAESIDLTLDDENTDALAPSRPPPLRLLSLADLRPGRPSADPSKKAKIVSLPPLSLSTPSLLAKHLPCIVVPPSPLPPEVASALYLNLLRISEGWPTNKWVINDRQVESTHTAAFYVSATSPPFYDPNDLQNAGTLWYNGLPQPPSLAFPPLLQRAADLIEPTVNAEIQKRARFKGEWMGEWKARACVVNRYEGSDQGVGAHSDQLTYLGPFPTIASLSLGTARTFRLRAVAATDAELRSKEEPARTFDVPLSHNSFLIMHPPCQERYKHSIPPQKAIDAFYPKWNAEERFIPAEDRERCKARMGLTFRFFRDDWAAASTPLCYCGTPAVLKADQKHKLTSGDDPFAPYAHVWMCQVKTGAEGTLTSCHFYKIMDAVAEGRKGWSGEEAQHDRGEEKILG